MPELIELAVGSNVARELVTPDVLGPDSVAGKVTASAGDFLGLPAGIPVAAGSGDNPAAALGVGATEDHLVVSLGTSGTAYAVSPVPTQDPTGEVAGFADATGRFLPLSCMLNCTRVVDVIARPFGLGSVEALDLAGNEEPGAGGLFFLPYLAGERTPDLPDSRGELRGISMENVEPSRFVRAAVDGVAAGLAYCAEALADAGIRAPRIVLVGGGSQHATWQQSIADATGLPVEVRGGDEHVARGAAIQAMAATGSDTVLKVVDQWRPETLVRVEPRNEYREAFQLDRRRQIIESMKSANSTGI